MYVNVPRSHKSLANPYPHTPGMAASLADHISDQDASRRLDGCPARRLGSHFLYHPLVH